METVSRSRHRARQRPSAKPAILVHVAVEHTYCAQVKDERSSTAAPAVALAPPPTGNDVGAAPALEFGWVPAPVVRALLEEVGNFRARAEAIELLHAAVLDVGRVPGPWPPGTVLPTLSAFLAFLLRLVGDPNFKIAISAMTILEDLVGPLGADVRPYLGTMMPPLIQRMGDNVQVGSVGGGRQAFGQVVLYAWVDDSSMQVWVGGQL